jgi:hypothetical protein
MTTTPADTFSSRLQKAGEEILGPVNAPRGTAQRRILIARSALAYGGIITTLVQIVVWLTIGVFTGHLGSPWWLLTTVPVAAAVAGLTAVDRWHTWWATASTTDPTRCK